MEAESQANMAWVKYRLDLRGESAWKENVITDAKILIVAILINNAT